MIDFSTLVVELMKHESKIKVQNVNVEFHWNDGYDLDTLTFYNNVNFKQFNLKIVRHNWDTCFEFSISTNSDPKTYYRVDLETHNPIRIDKKAVGTIFWRPDIPYDLDSFAQLVYKIILDINWEVVQQKNKFNGHLSSQNQVGC